MRRLWGSPLSESTSSSGPAGSMAVSSEFLCALLHCWGSGCLRAMPIPRELEFVAEKMRPYRRVLPGTEARRPIAELTL